MGSFGTNVSPAHFVEIPDPLNSGQTKRPEAGTSLKARDYSTGTDLADIITTGMGFWVASYPGVDLLSVSGDGGATWVGPLQSGEAVASSTQAGSNASTALVVAGQANDKATLALSAAQNGPAASWDNIAGKPATFAPSAHSHATSQITVTPDVKAFLDSADKQAARAAIGAGTGNGTSNLSLGSTATTAAPGNHAHAASAVGFTPTGAITATDVQGAIAQAAQTGGSGGTTGSGTTLDVLYASGAYPTQPATAPAGIKVRHFYGPTQYQGATWAGVLDLYTYAALT